MPDENCTGVHRPNHARGPLTKAEPWKGELASGREESPVPRQHAINYRRDVHIASNVDQGQSIGQNILSKLSKYPSFPLAISC